MEIKKSSFWRNSFFSQKNKDSMQQYLNEMSANGFHISKIGKASCFFTEDAGVRYIYSICGEDDDALYTEQSGWTHFCNYKGVPFFRKAVPADAVKMVRTYKKKQEHLEKSWLNARLGEGLSLIGRVGNEYIFERTEEHRGFEYHIRHKTAPKKTKEGEVIAAPLGEISGLIFVCTNDDGSAYYFIKDENARNSVTENRGKRLSDQILAALITTGSALGFCASIALAIFGLIHKKLTTPLLIAGGIGVVIFAISFIVFFKKFQRISEQRKIRREEKRKEAERQRAENASPKQEEQPKPIEAPASTVVMNNIVMNNYGTDAGMQADPLSLANGQIFGQNPALDPSVNPALNPQTNPALAMADPQKIVKTVMDTVRYGDAADTINQGEAPDDDIWQGTEQFGGGQYTPEPAPFPQSTSIYDDDEWVGAEQDEDTDEDDEEDNDGGFPLAPFIANAIICLISVFAMIFGIRYGVTWFVKLGEGNVLALVFSLLAIGFSPFAFRYGLLSCKKMLEENNDDTFEE